MINREDILSMEYLKKTEFTGCNGGMRYRLEGVKDAEDKKVLRCTIWPEPFNFFTTPDDQKESAEFSFDDDGVQDAVRWMNGKLFEKKDVFDTASRKWDSYQ